MRTITVDEVTADWIDTVKKETGVIGVDHGTEVMCDDENAIVHMYIAWTRLKRVEEALR